MVAPVVGGGKDASGVRAEVMEAALKLQCGTVGSPASRRRRI